MKDTRTETSPAEYLALLIAELGEDAPERAPKDLRAFVAQLLDAVPAGIEDHELAAYYEQSLAPGDRERVQRALASDPSALADLIALDEVSRAYEAFGSEGSPEDAGRRAAEAASELVPHRPGPAGDGVETLLPGRVAKDEIAPPLLARAPENQRTSWPVTILTVVGIVVVVFLLGRLMETLGV